MLEYGMAGVCIVLTIFSMMARTNLRRWLGYNNFVDVTFTILMVLMFHGTFSGLISASIAGVVMSASLYVSKALLGYERLERQSMFKWEWVRHGGASLPSFNIDLSKLKEWVE